MVLHIIYLLIIGLVAGGIARLLVPGKDPIGLLGTIVVGIVGSLLGGFLADEIQYHRWSHSIHTSGIIGSIVGAIIVLIVARFATHGRA